MCTVAVASEGKVGRFVKRYGRRKKRTTGNVNSADNGLNQTPLVGSGERKSLSRWRNHFRKSTFVEVDPPDGPTSTKML